MLLSAAGSCDLMTLAAMLERARLPLARLTLESDMQVSTRPLGAYICDKIVHRPRIGLTPGATDAQQQRAARLAERAHHSCMISNALKGNVIINIAPDITTAG